MIMPQHDEEPRLTHEPVLLQEVLDWLKPEGGGLFIDCTLGLGGHTQAILTQAPQARVIGLDQDEEALAIARERLAQFKERVQLVHANFREIAAVAKRLGIKDVQGILADLGVSSLQLDKGERGFSFTVEAPLDMRMDKSGGQTAAELTARLSEKELADLIFEYGEEHGARRIAKAIVKARREQPITTTKQLADLVIRALHIKGYWRIHPATRTFQALRIAVNDELRALEAFIPAAISLLATGGRLAIISFHSLEDRIVKRRFQIESGRCFCESRIRAAKYATAVDIETQVCPECGAQRRITPLTRKPVRPTDEESARNPRSRSALMRVCERV